MKNMNSEELASEIYEISEENIYKVLERLDNNPNIDKSLAYIFIKAFFMHVANLKMEDKEFFEKVYSQYRVNLEVYYRSNNVQIAQELIEQILEVFDNSYKLIESLGFHNIEDSYEFRHHTIQAFELLRKILEKKSKAEIRVDLFEDCIQYFIKDAEKIEL